jgi:hypothetical protein
LRHQPDRVLLLGAAAAGLIVGQQVAGKAVRDALFLSCYPARALPLVMMAAAVVSVAVALGTGRLLAARGPRRTVEALIAVNAALLLLGFLVASWSLPVAAVLVYLQIGAAGGTLTSGYWSVVNERFDPWTAKRVVGRLGLGASLGAVAGGMVAWALAGWIPLPAMLLLMAGLNVAALVFVVRFAGDAPAQRTPTGGARPSPLGGLRGMPYLRALALLVALGAATEALLDYVLKSRAAATFPGGAELLAFFAAFHTGVGLLGLAAQSLATRPALETLGLAGSVALRPLAVALASVAGVVDPRLWSAVLGRGGHDVMTSSLFRSGYELLYTPLPEAEKRAAKPLVDVAADKAGALLGGALALLAVRGLGAPERPLFLVAGALSLLALGLTARLHRGYVAALEESLRAGRVRLDLTEVVDSTTRLTLFGSRAGLGDWRPQLSTGAAASSGGAEAAAPTDLADPILERIAELRSGQTARVGRALHCGPVDPTLVPHLLPLLARGDVYLEVVRALRQVAPRTTGQLADTLLDPDADPIVRRRLPRVLKACATRRAADALVLGLEDPIPEVRSQCALALASLTARAPELRVPRETAFGAARRELARPASPGSLEHVFVLLSLVLEREPLRTASSALRGEDVALKGTALEYLENVLPVDVSRALMALVGVAPPTGRIRALQDVLSDLGRRSR